MTCLTQATCKPRRRSRRWVAGLSVVVGLAVMVPEGSAAILASEKPVSHLIDTAGLQTARRMTAVSESPASTPRLSPPAPLATASVEDVLAREVVDRTNAERAAVGIAPLTALPELATAASFHVEDQRNEVCKSGILTHTGSDGSRGGDRILRTGLDISRWGENIACGHPTPEAVVEGWMNSPGHRANILDARLTHIGVATDRSDTTGYLYWVQDFATLR